MRRTSAFADLEGTRQRVAYLHAELSEGERLTSEGALDQRPASIRPDASHLVREDAERHSELGCGGRHRVVTGDDEESFGALCRVLADEDPAK